MTTDRDLLRDLDRQLRPIKDEGAPQAAVSPTARFDISGVLEAVRVTASSLAAMAARIRELEEHSDAFEASNSALGAQGRSLAADLDLASRQRDDLAKKLEAEGRRLRQLERLAEHHALRVEDLERELDVTRGALAEVVEAVEYAFGSPDRGSATNA